MRVETRETLSPGPLLDAFENFSGRFIDFEAQAVTPAGELRALRDQLAKALRDGGLQPGDRVLLCVGNGSTFVAALAAILACDASPLLLHRETPPQELHRYALAFGARRVLVERWSAAEMSEAIPEVESLPFGSRGGFRLAAVDESQPGFQSDFPALGGVPLHPTSGTTGRPKIAVRPAEVAMTEARSYQRTLGVEASDCLLCAVPMSHAYGFGACVTTPLLTGADVVSLQQFNPRAALRALREFPVTIFPAAPAMLDLLLNLAGDDREIRYPSRVLSAGSPLPERISARFLEQTGDVVQPLYGTTETGAITVAADPSDPCQGPCVGPPMEGVRVEIRPCEEADGLTAGVGRVYVNSPSSMSGYLSPTGIDASPLEDGWFETGDLGRLDERGAVHLVGREKDVINVFGMKVVPAEIEEVIAAFPHVADVKVYAGEHRSGSETVKAAVAAPESLDVAGLREYCERHLAPYKRPTRFYRLDALPRSPLGKILRDELP